MGLPLSPEILRAAYEFLYVTPPFKGLNLPPSDYVVFRVFSSPRFEGDYDFVRGYHTIRISDRLIDHTNSLLQTMAHEMLHLHEQQLGIRSHHGVRFRMYATLVCKYHGWDPKLFMGVVT